VHHPPLVNPKRQGIWPSDLGGLAFAPRGKASLEWIAALKEDNASMVADQDVPDQVWGGGGVGWGDRSSD